MPTFTAIQKITVGSGGAANMSFTSIPSTYTHLCLEISARTNRSSTQDYNNFRFNSDSGANYFYRSFAGYSTGSFITTLDNSQTSAYCGLTAGNTAYSNMFAANTVWIFDYTASKFKTYVSDSTLNNGSNREVNMQGGYWNSTSAITSITIFMQVGSLYLEHTTATLYGIANS
jgi:hypothetical protein